MSQSVVRAELGLFLQARPCLIPREMVDSTRVTQPEVEP
jgi:hypothetical protein